MIYLWTFLGGYVACLFVERAVKAWLVTHRAPPPTMAKRKQPNAQGEKVDVDYSWINVAGERE